MSLPEESLWCPRCKREHGSETLGIVWIRHEDTGGEQIHIVESQQGLDNLRESLDIENNEYELVEISALCK